LVGRGVFVGIGLIGRPGVSVGGTGLNFGVLLGVRVAVAVGVGVTVGLFISSKKNRIEGGVGSSVTVVAVEYADGNATK